MKNVFVETGFKPVSTDPRLKRSGMTICFGWLRVLRSFAMTGGILLFVCLPAFAVDKHQAIADFVQAGNIYKQEKYAEAIVAYRKVLDEGFESGPLYYNLANSYYRDGKTGLAVLNYERAAQLIPRDRDLKFNNQYLFSRHPDIRPDQQKNFVELAIDKHIEFYTLDEMTVILFGLFAGLGLFWLAAFHWRWKRSTVIIVLVLMIFVIGLYAAGFVFKMADVRGKAVTLKKVFANFEPRSAATEHFQLQEGSLVKILKQVDGWTKVQRWDKKQGWIPDGSVERVRP